MTGVESDTAARELRTMALGLRELDAMFGELWELAAQLRAEGNRAAGDAVLAVIRRSVERVQEATSHLSA